MAFSSASFFAPLPSLLTISVTGSNVGFSPHCCNGIQQKRTTIWEKAYPSYFVLSGTIGQVSRYFWVRGVLALPSMRRYPLHVPRIACSRTLSPTRPGIHQFLVANGIKRGLRAFEWKQNGGLYSERTQGPFAPVCASSPLALVAGFSFSCWRLLFSRTGEDCGDVRFNSPHGLDENQTTDVFGLGTVTSVMSLVETAWTV